MLMTPDFLTDVSIYGFLKWFSSSPKISWSLKPLNLSIYIIYIMTLKLALSHYLWDRWPIFKKTCEQLGAMRLIFLKKWMVLRNKQNTTNNQFITKKLQKSLRNIDICKREREREIPAGLRQSAYPWVPFGRCLQKLRDF